MNHPKKDNYLFYPLWVKKNTQTLREHKPYVSRDCGEKFRAVMQKHKSMNDTKVKVSSF